MSADGPAIYCALVHHPVRDRAGATVTTAVTTLDVHDIARSARTFGLAGYFVVTPIEAQHVLVERILEHWRSGAGRKRMPERHEALTLVRTVASVDDACDAVAERHGGRRPALWATSARLPEGAAACSTATAAAELGTDPTLILFGTGHGLAEELIARADRLLEPIHGAGYNHLSVRSAAAILLDRLWTARQAER